jgi:hypothetical protein
VIGTYTLGVLAENTGALFAQSARATTRAHRWEW